MEENIVDYLLDLLKTKGADIQYGNEDVTQLEHALQCAELAENINYQDQQLLQHYCMMLATLFMRTAIPFMKAKMVIIKI